MPEPRSCLITVSLTGMLLLCCSTAAGAAQTNTGEISGVVRDTQGGVLPGSTVVAEHVGSKITIARVADAQGRYQLPSLRVGAYVITVELAGFRRVVQSGVIVQLGQTVPLDFRLEVGGPTEEVLVTADVPLLQRTNAEISDVIENRVVVQLPLNGRNFLALAQLSNAVVIPPGGTRGDALQQAGPLPNVGGQRSGHNIYLLDGVKTNGFRGSLFEFRLQAAAEWSTLLDIEPARVNGLPVLSGGAPVATVVSQAKN